MAKDGYYERIETWWRHYCNIADDGKHGGVPCAYCGESPELMPWKWPLKSPILLPDTPGCFGAERTKDIHTGVDLYCEPDTEVVAVEDGVVVGIEIFTGKNAGSPWWNETYAVLVAGETGVVVYGEVNTILEVGFHVPRGGQVGHVLPVLRKFKGRPMVMLHLELMRHGASETVWWHYSNKQSVSRRPECLLDPTPFLPDRPVFNLADYDGKAFRPREGESY